MVSNNLQAVKDLPSDDVCVCGKVGCDGWCSEWMQARVEELDAEFNFYEEYERQRVAAAITTQRFIVGCGEFMLPDESEAA